VKFAPVCSASIDDGVDDTIGSVDRDDKDDDGLWTRNDDQDDQDDDDEDAREGRR